MRTDPPGLVGVGFVVQPEPDWIARTVPCLAAADLLEITPETLWVPHHEEFRPNRYLRQVQELQQKLGVPVVAHGVSLSVASCDPSDAPRQARWLERVRALHAELELGWYTDHFGLTHMGGLHVTLPLPVPALGPVARALSRRLDEMAEIVGLAGVENTAFPYLLAEPEEEAGLLASALGDKHALVLDLHNLDVHRQNFGIDPRRWLSRAPLHRVVEVHVSGGSRSDPRWLPSGRTQRLDSHDGPVPEEVWALLDQVLPHLTGLRAVVLERMEGTVGDADVDELLSTMERIRQAIARSREVVAAPLPRPTPVELPEIDEGALLQFERTLAEALVSADPVGVLSRLQPREALQHGALQHEVLQSALARALLDPDGLRIAELLIAKLRFQRLIQGHPSADAWFERDPAQFTAAFRAYHRAIPPRELSPAGEWRAFGTWAGLRD